VRGKLDTLDQIAEALTHDGLTPMVYWSSDTLHKIAELADVL
jgi:hypothetical protein